MSLDINSLKRFEPLKENEYIGPYVDISNWGILRLTFYSDVLMEICIQFSPDGIIHALMNTYRTNLSWQTVKIDIVLPYCRLVIKKISDAENKVLCVNVLCRKGGAEIQKVEPKKEEIKEQEPEKEEHRSKSPFKRILKSGRRESKGSISTNQNTKVECIDPRFLSFIPKGGILVGSFNNTVSVIPPPNSDSYCFLTYNNGVFAWVDLDIDNTDHKNVSWKI